MKLGNLCLMAMAVFALASPSLLMAQQPPDTILYNGKIATIDNHEVNENIGTIVQAMAIRDGKIVSVGSNADVRRLAGSTTKSLDLKGRLVTPGFGATHDHPADWNTINPTVVGKVVPDSIQVDRFINVPPDQVMQEFPKVLNEAVSKAKPGMWIRIGVLYGPEYRWGDEISAMFGRQINKQMLDLAAPNNPVEIRGGFTSMVVNQKAYEEFRKFYADQWDKFLYPPLGDLGGSTALAEFEKNGTCGTCYRYMEQDVIYPPKLLREVYRLGNSWTSAIGVTMNGTAIYTAGAMKAYDSLDRANQLDVRIPYGYFWPFRNDFFGDPYFAQFVATQVGRGSDFFWHGGMTSMMGAGCSQLPGTSPEVKQREPKCRFDPQAVNGAYQALYKYIKAGGRLFGDHQMGDGEVDLVMDAIEKGSKDAGFTTAEIHSKRHVTEHMHMYPRPDQIPRIKELGIITSGWNLDIWEGGGMEVLRDYGERGAMQMIPRKSLYDAGIRNSVEIDRPISEYTNLTYFTVLYSGITRKDQDGNVIAPQQAVSREAMLKSATQFAAYDSLREDVLGTLEPGKWADLIIIDRDYLTVPVDEILKLKVLMTMVGGKMKHLAPSLAREWGVPPTGAQIDLGGPATKW